MMRFVTKNERLKNGVDKKYFLWYNIKAAKREVTNQNKESKKQKHGFG